MWNTRARLSRVRPSYQRGQKRSVVRSPPLGMEGGTSIGGMGGGMGKDAPTKLLKQRSGGVGVKDACKLAR